MNQRGNSLISVALAGGLAAATLLAVAGGLGSLAGRTKASQDTLAANLLATELLEYFISMKADRFRAVMGANPISPTTLGSYPLCAPINLLDRTSSNGAILNRNPLADVPSNTTLVGANRFFRFEVVNLGSSSNITSRRDLCGQDPRTMNLAASERFLVTVGLTWLKDSAGNLGSTSVSGLILTTAGPAPTPIPTARWFAAPDQECGSFCSGIGRVNVRSPDTSIVNGTTTYPILGSFCASGENNSPSAHAAMLAGTISFLYGCWETGGTCIYIHEEQNGQSVGGYCYGTYAANGNGPQVQDNDQTDRTMACYCQ